MNAVMKASTIKCAVCTAQIKPAFLMCVAHWRLVPLAEQKALNTTWFHYLCMPPRSGAGLIARTAYLDARAKAVASANAAINTVLTPLKDAQ